MRFAIEFISHNAVSLLFQSIVIVIVLVLFKYRIQDFAPPFNQTSVVQNVLVAVLNAAWKEVLVLRSREE